MYVAARTVSRFSISENWSVRKLTAWARWLSCSNIKIQKAPNNKTNRWGNHSAQTRYFPTHWFPETGNYFAGDKRAAIRHTKLLVESPLKKWLKKDTLNSQKRAISCEVTAIVRKSGAIKTMIKTGRQGWQNFFSGCVPKP